MTSILDPVIEAIRAIDPVDLAAAVSVLPDGDEHREAIALGLILNDHHRIRLQDLREASNAVHGGGTAEMWRALANRDRREAVLARRSTPLTPVYCQNPRCNARGDGKSAVVHLEHPLPPLDQVLCTRCADTSRAKPAVAA